jgi:hypothetical protein
VGEGRVSARTVVVERRAKMVEVSVVNLILLL